MYSKKNKNQRVIYVEKPSSQAPLNPPTEPKEKAIVEEEKKIEVSKQTTTQQNSLTKTLIQQFKSKKVECPICYNKIHNEARVWSCRQCFQPYHLSCILKWITNSNSNKKSEAFSLVNWSCPKCCFQYAEAQPQYFCFCGKYSNPEYDPYLIPHSCGDVCGKKNQCEHACQMKCHPGPCPPCLLVQKKVVCYCGKSFFLTKCNDEAVNYECGSVCGKTLNCKEHTCKRKCHLGPCNPCDIQIESECFCAKTRKSVSCGLQNFSCESVCDKALDCKLHKCTLICHPGQCPPCLLKPELVKTCPCGKTTLNTLMGPNARKTCMDPIAICGMPCGKLLPCGLHYCKEMCHLKPACGACKELVDQECRCGRKKRKIECHKLRTEVFLCEKVCKKKKSCQVHTCAEVCCPANAKEDATGLHLCLKICGKKLTCGLHNCDLFCHLGYCKPCPIYINVPITCVCGKTVKNPPLPCGTKRPTCTYPCSRQRPCGHPCELECHEDECPPCTAHIDKPCICKRYIMKGVPCCKEVSCSEPCDVPLKCGHLCQIVCHENDCPGLEPAFLCTQKCNNLRDDCSHRCLACCHGAEPCPKEFCKVLSKISCACGNRFGFIECGYLRNKVLKCDSICRSKQRFGTIVGSDFKKYSSGLLRFARSEYGFLVKLEEKIEKILKNGQNSLEVSIKNFNSNKIWNLQTLLVIYYQLDVEIYLHIDNPFAVIAASKSMKTPKYRLSSYLKDIESGRNKPEDAPFEAVIKFYAPNIRSIAFDVEIAVKEANVDYVLENGEKMINIYLWDLPDAELVMRKLKKKNLTNYQFEKNLKIKSEEEKIGHILDDVVDKEENKCEESKE